MTVLSSFLKSTTTRLLDFLLPPLCLICDEPVGGTATLCPSCWKQIQFIAPPFCARCGAPFDIPVEGDLLCGACLAEEPPYRSARTAMLYDDASRKLILGFKHSDRTHAAKALAAWMYRAGSPAIAETDALVPVPLHRWRLFRRRYNQSALLALEIGRLSQKPTLLHALHRVRATPSQGHLKRKERRENVHKAFAVPEKEKATVAGKKLLLIDDVMTTGATVEECARTLLAAGAAQVDVLTLARVKSVV